MYIDRDSLSPHFFLISLCESSEILCLLSKENPSNIHSQSVHLPPSPVPCPLPFILFSSQLFYQVRVFSISSYILNAHSLTHSFIPKYPLISLDSQVYGFGQVKICPKSEIYQSSKFYRVSSLIPLPRTVCP